PTGQYLNKLLEVYKKEIKKRTELFYQELSLDNNEVNAKYGNADLSYLELLKNLTGESEPDQVISAFKIVALIVATDKAKEKSDHMKGMVRVPAILKKNNLKYFQKIKDEWDLITEAKT